MKKSLYNITKEALELASALEEGELTPELETALAINQNELQEKAINYGYAIKSLEEDVTTITEEIRRLTAKTTVTADKIAIKKAIKQGENITGARIVEKLNLQIK
jgi:hypothetical protein